MDYVFLDCSVGHPPPFVLREGGGEVVHTFGLEELTEVGDSGRAAAIVHHGEGKEVEGYSAIYSHTEILPLYVGREAGVVSLNLEQTKDIFAGRALTWSHVGGSEHKISMFVLSGELERRAVDFHLQEAGVEFGAASEQRSDYEGLAAALAEFPGALAVGLRSEAASVAGVDTVRRIDPRVESDGDKQVAGGRVFHVNVSLHVKTAHDEAVLVAERWLRAVSERVEEDGSTYPLDDRLSEMRHGGSDAQG